MPPSHDFSSPSLTPRLVQFFATDFAPWTPVFGALERAVHRCSVDLYAGSGPSICTIHNLLKGHTRTTLGRLVCY